MGDGISSVTLSPDFPRAFATKGATLIAGTGYQYGDTDFEAYNERLYLEFSRQLRRGPEKRPVSVGKALVEAKHAYLADVPTLRGIDEKSILQAALFGLPQLSVNMPGDRFNPDAEDSIITGVEPYTAHPGDVLGLARGVDNVPGQPDVHIKMNLDTQHRTLTEPEDPSNPVPVTSLTGCEGPDAVLSEPADPVLPLELRNISFHDRVLRGVGFRGGTYRDTFHVHPLTGAPATEASSPHGPFESSVFFPIRPWSVNYFGALTGNVTRLAVTPAQYVSSPDADDDTLRQFDDMDFRLFYSDERDPRGPIGPVWIGPRPSLRSRPRPPRTVRS